MAEGWIQVAIDGAGKRVRNLLNNIAGTDVYQQVVTRAKSNGTLMDDEATEATLASVKTDTAHLDIALSALRDAIAGGKTQADIVTALAGVLVVSGTVAVSNLTADQLVHAANLDVALSTRLKPGDSVVSAQGAAAAAAQAWPVEVVSSSSPYLPLDVMNGVIRNAAELAAVDPRTGFQPMAARAGSRDSVGQR